MLDAAPSRWGRRRVAIRLPRRQHCENRCSTCSARSRPRGPDGGSTHLIRHIARRPSATSCGAAATSPLRAGHRLAFASGGLPSSRPRGLHPCSRCPWRRRRAHARRSALLLKLDDVYWTERHRQRPGRVRGGRDPVGAGARARVLRRGEAVVLEDGPEPPRSGPPPSPPPAIAPRMADQHGSGPAHPRRPARRRLAAAEAAGRRVAPRAGARPAPPAPRPSRPRSPRPPAAAAATARARFRPAPSRRPSPRGTPPLVLSGGAPSRRAIIDGVIVTSPRSSPHPARRAWDSRWTPTAGGGVRGRPARVCRHRRCELPLRADPHGPHGRADDRKMPSATAWCGHGRTMDFGWAFLRESSSSARLRRPVELPLRSPRC